MVCLSGSIPSFLENYIVNLEIFKGGYSILNNVKVSVSSSKVFNFIFCYFLSLAEFYFTDFDKAFKLNESNLAVF